MVKTIQYWSGIDYCDDCDKPIQRDEEVNIYASDETGIISIRCPECLGALEELIQGYKELGRQMKIVYLLFNAQMLIAIYLYPLLRSVVIPIAVLFNVGVISISLMSRYVTRMPRWKGTTLGFICMGILTLLCLYTLPQNAGLIGMAVWFSIALLTWKTRRTPFELYLDYKMKKEAGTDGS